MAKTIDMPKLGVTMDEGKIVEWHFAVGDQVAKGAVLVSIEGDKAVTEYESPEEGVLLQIIAQPDEVVECGNPICVIGQAGEQVDGGSTAAPAAAPVAPAAPAEAPAQAPVVSGAAKVIDMPKLGVTMDEGKIVEWHFAVGDHVAKGAVLVSIEGDKAVTEYESPEEGYLLQIIAQADEVIECGNPICVIGEKGAQVGVAAAPAASSAPAEAAAAAAATPAAPVAVQATAGKVKAVPLVRKLAAERGIDLTQVKGSGPAGRITKDDVLNYVAAPKAEAKAAEAPAAAAQVSGDRIVTRVVPLTGMRGAITKSMTKSIVEGPQGTQFKEIDATWLLELQEVMAPAILEQTGNKLSVLAILVKAVAKALEQHPVINTIVEDNQIKYIENVNIGIAVAVEDGLLVPVLHNANKMSLGDIVVKIKELAIKAREGKLKPAEMSGATFTITNLGMFNTGFFTPLLNPPESAILGIGSITKKPAVVDDQIVARPMLPLSLTIDHRSVDGAPAAQFLMTLEKMLRTPWQQRINDISF
ncbi:MAG: 2-oxo acid dehydrogenase subunit E2 [Peptococcia bacterium]